MRGAEKVLLIEDLVVGVLQVGTNQYSDFFDRIGFVDANSTTIEIIIDFLDRTISPSS